MHLLSFASLLSCFFVFVFVSLFLHVYFIQIQRRAGAHPISQLYHALARHGHFDVINAARPKYAKSLPRKVPGKQQLSIGECSYANCRRAHFIVLPHTTLLYWWTPLYCIAAHMLQLHIYHLTQNLLISLGYLQLYSQFRGLGSKLFWNPGIAKLDPSILSFWWWIWRQKVR